MGGGGTLLYFAADRKPLALAGGGGAWWSKGKGRNVCVSDAALQSLLGVGGGGALITKSMDPAMKMDKATNPVQGTTEEIILRRWSGRL